MKIGSSRAAAFGWDFLHPECYDDGMPTVLRVGRFRFFFFSNERQEPPHIHVKAGSDEAKFWLEPVQIVVNYGFNGRELNRIQRLVEQHRDELLEAWHEHFGA